MSEKPAAAGGAIGCDLKDLKVDLSNPMGEGGAAEVFRCTTRTGSRRILKLYNADALKRIDVNALHHLIDLPLRLSDDDQIQLSRLCAWPESVVIKDSKLVGILMPEAPARFFIHRKGIAEPRHFSRLAVREDRATKGGYPYYDFPQKIARLGNLLAALDFLHSVDIVIGDLQWNNILTTGTEPYNGETSSDVYLLDCDSFIVGGRAPLTNMDPMSWKPPYPTNGFSAATDMFKFSLMVIRCLSEQTNQESIDYSLYARLLPSSDFNKLHLLLTKPDPGLTAGDLRALARAWQSSVSRTGRMYRRTDNAAREPWTAAMRKTHFAGLPPAPVSVGNSAQHQPSRTLKARGANSPKATSPAAAPPLPPYVEPPSPPEGISTRKMLLGIGAVLLIIYLVIVAAQNADNSTSSSVPTRSTTVSSSTVSSVVNPIRTASVGDCIHRDPGAEIDGGTARYVEVRGAVCGSDYATDRVIAVVASVESCGPEWVSSTNPPPPVVLCLQPV